MRNKTTLDDVGFISVCNHDGGRMSITFVEGDHQVVAYLTSKQVDTLLEMIAARREEATK